MRPFALNNPEGQKSNPKTIEGLKAKNPYKYLKNRGNIH